MPEQQKQEVKIFTIEGNNPLAYYGDADSPKKSFTEEELFRFYYSHYPEVVQATFEDVKEFLSGIGANLQQVD